MTFGLDRAAHGGERSAAGDQQQHGQRRKHQDRCHRRQNDVLERPFQGIEIPFHRDQNERGDGGDFQEDVQGEQVRQQHHAVHAGHRDQHEIDEIDPLLLLVDRLRADKKGSERHDADRQQQHAAEIVRHQSEREKAAQHILAARQRRRGEQNRIGLHQRKRQGHPQARLPEPADGQIQDHHGH